MSAVSNTRNSAGTNVLCPSVVSFNSIIINVECSLLLLVTSASDLLLRTIKLCSVLFIVVVHAGCDKQDSLMHAGL